MNNKYKEINSYDAKIEKITKIMDTIEYGFKDEKGNNIILYDTEKWEKEFYELYYLQSPNELLISKCGVCWDQVELERTLFKEVGIDVNSYFICIYNDDSLPSHTFITFELNKKIFWYEHSWNKYKGIYCYNTLNELLYDVKEKFINDNLQYKNDNKTIIHKYNEPKKHSSCQEFYQYIESQLLVDL